MKKVLLCGAILAATVGLTTVIQTAKADPTPDPNPTVKNATSVYQFTVKSLDGKDVDLSKYKGKVLLIVNTASKCGFTPQYAALQKLQDKYAGQGLAVLGFPANDFGGQEPGTNAEIGAFCQRNYGVTFDLFSKVPVKGANKTSLFRYLTEEANPTMTGEIGWNFEKFLISRDGKLVGRFKSAVKPDSDTLTQALEAQLKATG
jgi:glutathione peroxidase